MNDRIGSFDSRTLRRALGNFATGITVVTASTPEGAQAGVTANSFNSVSLEPPLVLWSIDKRSGSWEVFQRASHFAVNILAADQVDISNRFARPGPDKFSGIACATGIGQAPLLPDCAACFQCEQYQTVDGGDHWILIGKVVAFTDNGRAPLLYHQGSYCVAHPHTQPPHSTEPDDNDGGALLADNYYYLMLQAVRAYQQDYLPRQRATGLRTSEARLLMVLKERAAARDRLIRLVDMPAIDIDDAVETLSRKELIYTGADNAYALTGAGERQSAALWQIARQEQQRVFAGFSTQELSAFHRVIGAVAGLSV